MRQDGYLEGAHDAQELQREAGWPHVAVAAQAQHLEPAAHAHANNVARPNIGQAAEFPQAMQKAQKHPPSFAPSQLAQALPQRPAQVCATAA